jgi:hypothetical protein
MIVSAQHCESLGAIEPGDEPRRRTTERSAAVEQQERPARRSDIPEPGRIEHEAIHASAQYRRHGDVIRHGSPQFRMTADLIAG